jgi:hypothetical protein
MTATTVDRTTVMTQARNPCEYWCSGGRECVYRKDDRATTLDAANDGKTLFDVRNDIISNRAIVSMSSSGIRLTLKVSPKDGYPA